MSPRRLGSEVEQQVVAERVAALAAGQVPEEHARRYMLYGRCADCGGPRDTWTSRDGRTSVLGCPTCYRGPGQRQGRRRPARRTR